jgi:hypothetical protein
MGAKWIEKLKAFTIKLIPDRIFKRQINDYGF